LEELSSLNCTNSSVYYGFYLAFFICKIKQEISLIILTNSQLMRAGIENYICISKIKQGSSLIKLTDPALARVEIDNYLCICKIRN